MYGIDIDSLQSPEYVKWWERIIDIVDFIETRNSTCADQLKKITNRSEKIIDGVDLTHGFYTKEEQTLTEAEFRKLNDLEDPYIIWAIAMPWNSVELKQTTIRNRYDRLCGQFRHLLMQHQNVNHVFLPYFDETDIEMIHNVLRDTSCRYHIISSDSPIGEKRLYFKYALSAVVMRFHGVQFALFHAKSFVAVSYSPKITNILNELGLQDRYAEFGIRKDSCFMKEFDITDEIWEEIEDIQKSVIPNINQISEKLKDIANERKKILLDWIK